MRLDDVELSDDIKGLKKKKNGISDIILEFKNGNVAKIYENWNAIDTHVIFKDNCRVMHISGQTNIDFIKYVLDYLGKEDEKNDGCN